MKHEKIRILFMMVTVLTCLVANAQLEVKELKLSNGMTVWLNEDHSQPKVFGAVVVRAGGKDYPNTGIAHYFEHIMFKGTDRLGTVDYQAEKPWLDSISAQYDLLSQTRDEVSRMQIQQHINALSLRAADYAIPNEFNRLISKYGGSGLNAATGFDETFYYNTFLPQYMEHWCVLNSERLMHPVFRGFQGELENVYEEKNRSADGIGDAMEKVLKAVFKNQPYAYPIIGSTESLKNPRLSDMETFFHQYYVASNMCLMLCGDITPDSTLTALLERTFGRVQTGPAPQRKKSPMPIISAGEKCEIRLPIPLVGVEALVFKSPTDFEPDADALSLANMLLSNGKAGLLDSLMNEHKVMAALAHSMSLADAAGTALLVVPKLLGSMSKAQECVLEQVRRIMNGQFSDEQLEAQKYELLMDAERSLETIDARSQLMIEVYAKGYTWADVLKKVEHIKTLTRQDIMQAARKYYGANYLTLRKKFGTPDKERLSQPGYQPVRPKNMDARSALAQELEQLPVHEQDIRTVDFQRDITIRQLTTHTMLYYKENPINDIFTFTLRYKTGTKNNPRLKVLDQYLNTIGTDSLRKQQLASAWQRLGVTMLAEAGDKTFDINLTGPERNLQPALRLLSHILTSAKGDKDALDDIKDDNKVSRKSFGKQKNEVALAMMERLLFGQKSTYLTQLSKKEVKALKDEDLLVTLNEVLQYDCDVLYCGRQPLQSVTDELQQVLPLARCQKPQQDTYRLPQQYTEPTVFFYDVPKSRQNYVISYDQLPATPTAEQRTLQELWSRYFGEGMSSVLFQNVREFRSLAYSTVGKTAVPSLATHPSEPTGYITMTGTQSDKTMEVMAIIDSLLRQLPMKPENLDAARQEALNSIQNNYPSFRDICDYVSQQRLNGYKEDPNVRLVRLLPAVSAYDVAQYHRQYVASNKCRVWLVIGDKKLTDLKALARYGRVVELKKNDVYR